MSLCFVKYRESCLPRIDYFCTTVSTDANLATILKDRYLYLIICRYMTKEEKYISIIPRIHSLLSDETDIIARMANVAALLHSEFDFWWTGFYRVSEDNDLVLGPFQGPIACMRIAKGRGVCGTAWEDMRTIIVPDVEKFPGHIACSSESRSEIVVPCLANGKIAAVLDIDSKSLSNFDNVDQKYLEKVADMLFGKGKDI